MFQLIRIGDAVIVPLPFEVTVESGRRMAARVKREFVEAGHSDVRHVWVASVANGYFGYATTPEEYARQNYEGGHTLYGRYTTPYLTAQLGLLARDLLAGGEVHELMPEWRYRLKVNTFYPEPRPATGRRRVLVQPTVVAARRDYEETYIYFRWEDVGPSRIDFHRSLSRVEVRRDGSWGLMRVSGEPIDDDGYDLEIRHLRTLAGGMGKYEVRWYNPVPGGEYRFVIDSRGACATLTSGAFLYEGSRDGRDGKTTLAQRDAE
jgi:neutral ceramidase